MPASPPVLETNYASAARLSSADTPGEVLGRVEPRIWTPPLCDLSDPDSSYGYDLIDFADAIGWPLDPWQRWVAIHMGELLPDGRPRFRKVLIIVARQNGKTILSRILVLYWMFVECVPLIIGTSTDRKKAKKSWTKVIDMATSIDWIRDELQRPYRRDTTGEEDFWNIHGSHYEFAAPNSNAGRGDTLYRAVLDELREHGTFDAYDAIVGAMNAVPTAQLVCITNQSSTKPAPVLEYLRDAAHRYITTGEGDPRLGIIEYSAPEGSSPTDLHALAMANPDLNRRQLTSEVLLGEATSAVDKGGEVLDRYMAEYMCIPVNLNPNGVDAQAWADCTAEAPVNLARHRGRLALCLDVSRRGDHVTLAGAAVLDGRTHIEIIAAWSSTKDMKKDLPALVARIRPRVLGWYTHGPTAGVVAELRNPRHRAQDSTRWPPPGVKLDPISTELTAVCMGFDEQLTSRDLQHNDDPLLNDHKDNAKQRRIGDGWVYDRRTEEPIDALYAAAGAVHLARALPPPPPPLTAV